MFGEYLSSVDVPVLMREDGEPTKVIVLIPTINNCEELDCVLTALGKQSYPHFEIICVDSKSKDKTREVIEAHGASWIDDDSRNRADACNHGLKVIDCDIVLFTDDDVIPKNDWVEQLIRWFERPEVAGVGGPNFAPNEDSMGAKCADVAFTAKWVTAGTRYGKVPSGELVEIKHNPGCNSAYRKSVLDEIGGFESGCIGAEDVVMDHKITSAGHRLWFDPTAVMPHRRRKPISPYMKQLKNYGYVRTLANARWPELKAWSHSAIGFFPILVILSLITTIIGLFSGGINFSNPLDFPEMGWPRISVHLPISLLSLYLIICWFGATLGNSPHRNVITVFVSPIMIFLAHWSYGSGVLKGWRQIHFGDGAAAGLGVQIDDKQRTV